MEAKLICFLFLFLSVGRISSEDPPVVTTKQGRIAGIKLPFRPPRHPELHRSVDAYLGIPYAEPPVGPLRFKPPVAKSWSGELKATAIGNRCPQPTDNFGKLKVEGNFAEDCLVLDVFVPQPLPPNAAVLVYIHGGAYSIGAGIAEEGMTPTPLAAVGGVIVVTFNYRLGVLGFLSTADDVIPGNFGLLDQRLALEWVRDNIKAFEGDPKRVTVFGWSAGSASVNLHMISPGSAGLFRGAIMESGDATSPWATVPTDFARRVAFALGKLVGCEQDTSEGLLECLQKVEDIDSIIKSQKEEIPKEFSAFPFPLAPVVDGNFLPNLPTELYEKGAVNNAVSIIGANADEGMMIVILASLPGDSEEGPFINSTTYDAFSSMITSTLSADPIVAKAIKMMYDEATCTDGPHCNYLDSVAQVCGDHWTVCQNDKTARAFTKAGRKVYRYFMSHNPTTGLLGPSWAKSNHGDELLFVFGYPLVSSDEYQFTEDEARMSVRTMTYWSNLAKTGNPNLSSLDAELTEEEKKTEWPLFTVEGLEYKDLTPEMLNGRGIKARECLFWNEFIPELIKTVEDVKKGKDKWTKDGGRDTDTCTDEKCPEE